jgi:hypothetical protein
MMMTSPFTRGMLTGFPRQGGGFIYSFLFLLLFNPNALLSSSILLLTATCKMLGRFQIFICAPVFGANIRF